MLSSPSNADEHDSDHNPSNDNDDDDEDQDLFPSSDQPSTPKNNHLNAAAPGELSPPQSQSTSQQIQPEVDDSVKMSGMGDDEADDAYDNTNVDAHRTDGAGEMGEGQQNGGGMNTQYGPGMGWKNRKAQEEYQRAAETLVHRDFSLKEFGDLFDDRAVLSQQPEKQQEQGEQEDQEEKNKHAEPAEQEEKQQQHQQQQQKKQQPPEEEVQLDTEAQKD
jgi:hypothetical protein